MFLCRMPGDDPDEKISNATLNSRRRLAEVRCMCDEFSLTTAKPQKIRDEKVEQIKKEKPAPQCARDVVPTGPRCAAPQKPLKMKFVDEHFAPSSSEYELRNHIFIELSHDEEPLGRIVFRLYDEYAPQVIVSSFVALC